MKKCLFRIFIFSFVLPCMFLWGDTPGTYLDGRLLKENGRYHTFFEALRLLSEREVKVIVETGTERWANPQACFDGDGGSTIIFGHWAFANNALMFSVDINAIHLEYCQNNTSEYLSNLYLIHQDSVAFLEQFPYKIDFLYLDSYDYDEKNPRPAQLHCLNEIKAAESKLTANSIVMIDDCNIPRGGKGKLAINYLLLKGWKLHRNCHQVILIKNAF